MVDVAYSEPFEKHEFASRDLLGTRPLSRVKSASCVIDVGRLFLFGGYDEDDRRESIIRGLRSPTNEPQLMEMYTYWILKPTHGRPSQVWCIARATRRSTWVTMK